MEDYLKTFEKEIKKKHKFGFTPKFETTYPTQLSAMAFLAIAKQAFEELNWEIEYFEENQIEAKRKAKSLGMTSYTEQIKAQYDDGNIVVSSESLGSEMWDNGNNSKRVYLFIYAFREIEKRYDFESIKVLENEQEKIINWDNYEIPTQLPSPPKLKEPVFIIPVVGLIILSLILGFLIAQASIHGKYLFFLFEIIVAFALTYGLKYLIRLSNYTNFNHLNYLLFSAIFLTYFSNLYFQYKLIFDGENLYVISFFDFIKLKLEHGLVIDSLKTGWIGLVISWIFQLGFTQIIGNLRLKIITVIYQIERIPVEVTDFAYYHFLKNKDENEVRNELSKMGWTEEQQQNEVFEAIGGLYGAIEISKTN